jgi:hypothetical protein
MRDTLFNSEVQSDRMLISFSPAFQYTESKEVNGIHEESNPFDSKGKTHS